MLLGLWKKKMSLGGVGSFYFWRIQHGYDNIFGEPEQLSNSEYKEVRRSGSSVTTLLCVTNSLPKQLSQSFYDYIVDVTKWDEMSQIWFEKKTQLW